MLLLLQTGQTAAWLLSLMTGLLAALLLWPVGLVLRGIRGGSLLDLVEQGLGRWAVIPFTLIHVGGLCFAAGMILRETSEMAISAVFPHTPQTFATTALMLAAVYAAWGEASSLVRLGRLFLPLVLVGIALVLAGTVGWGEIRYLLPFWGPGIPRLIGGLPSATAIQFPAFLVLTMTGQVRDRQGLLPWLPLVPLLGGLVIALEKAVLQMVFAFPIGLQIAFPLHTASRLILGGRFFERLEGVWVFIWVVGTSILLGAILHASSAVFGRTFLLPRRQTAILPLATVVLTVAFFPHDQAQTIAWHLGATPLLFYLVLVMPSALDLILLARQGRRPA